MICKIHKLNIKINNNLQMMKIISLTIVFLFIINLSKTQDPIVVITSDKYFLIL
jgi:hypothetical protein